MNLREVGINDLEVKRLENSGGGGNGTTRDAAGVIEAVSARPTWMLSTWPGPLPPFLMGRTMKPPTRNRAVVQRVSGWDARITIVVLIDTETHQGNGLS